MLLAKALACLVLPLAIAGAIFHEEKSENIPPKSEIVFRIKRLLQMLRDRRKYKADKAQEEQEQVSTRSMVERRKRLEELLRENPGLSALIKKSFKRRKEEEVRMLENDPRRRCRPGIFFCKKSRDSSDSNEQDSLMKLSKLDEEITKRRGCRPGVFWCQSGDASVDTDSEKIASKTQMKSLELPETKPKDDSTKQDTRTVIDKLLSVLGKEQQDPHAKRRCRPGIFHCAQGDEGKKVGINRISPKISKKTESFKSVKEDPQRHRCRPGLFHCEPSREESNNDSKGGEQLADDLMESLDNNKNTKENEPPRSENTSFNVDQIAKILENSKR